MSLRSWRLRRRRSDLVCRDAVALMAEYLEGQLPTKDRARLEERGVCRGRLEGDMHGRSAACDVDSILFAAAGLRETYFLDDAGVQLVAVVA